MRRTSEAVVLALLLEAGLSGCNEMMDPWSDDLPSAGDVTTASVEGARAAKVEPSQRAREAQRSRVEPQDGTVTHWPLWWEDPFVDKGSQDGQFAWTAEDYFAIPYGLGRNLLNTMAWPVSAAVEPPFTLMGSDGKLSRQALGYDHDAERRPEGVAPPADILDIGAETGSALPADDAENEPSGPTLPATGTDP
jgi:hypothetical protein